MDKSSQRSLIVQILGSLTEQYRRNAAKVATLKLENSDIWEKVTTILCYLSFGAELDLDSLIGKSIQENKKVFVPKICNSGIDFFEITSPLHPQNKSVGIREPVEQTTKWHWSETEEFVVVLVPGLAFTREGHRLGRGGGHYDRFIMQSREATQQSTQSPILFLGICYEEQIVDTIPQKEHDQIMDGILSNRNLLLLNKEQL